MKTILSIITVALTLTLGVGDVFTTNFVDLSKPVIMATLQWNVTTNWHQTHTTRTLMAWTGDQDPNITTIHEAGIIQSNLIACIEWKGKISAVTLETVHVGTLHRSYVEKKVRVYEDAK